MQEALYIECIIVCVWCCVVLVSPGLVCGVHCTFFPVCVCIMHVLCVHIAYVCVNCVYPCEVCRCCTCQCLQVQHVPVYMCRCSMWQYVQVYVSVCWCSTCQCVCVVRIGQSLSTDYRYTSILGRWLPVRRNNNLRMGRSPH